MKKLKLIETSNAVVLILIMLLSTVSLFPNMPLRVSASEFGDAQAEESLSGIFQPVITRESKIDRDFNGIQDSLETKILEAKANESKVLPVLVTLIYPVSNQDLDHFRKLGGHVNHVYQHVTYGFSGRIPAVNIKAFASLARRKLAMIEYDTPICYHLDVGVPLVGARPTVWNTYGYMGSPSHSIAILDTGIDDTNPDVGGFGDLDFANKMVGWYDATPDHSSTPEDYGEHGTHVAGIAAGTGTANALQGSGVIETTFTYKLPSKPPGPWVYGYVDYIDVMNPGIIILNCGWGGDNEVLVVLSDPVGNEVKRTSGTSQPLILTHDTAGTPYPTGRYGVFVGNAAGPSGTPFSCIETYPYQGRNDGYNLFTGVAPNSKLVGVKVFDNTGSGTLSSLIAGMDWIVQNRMAYKIVVASMSLSLVNGAVDSTLDQKVDTMVQNGIVTTVSAGNNFPDYTIGSPGTAAYVITVGATNDQNGITSYSSNGDTLKNEYGLVKPDVAAPGGTFLSQYGNKIVSADSNDVDASYSGYSDRNLDDYQQMAGTSMAAPHVAGLAALLVQAMGGWSWTLEEALRVKMIISMTAFETQIGEETNQPPLNRGEKDNVEGYGRISADAAIEAVEMNYNIGEQASDNLGSESSDKKVWARQVLLSAGHKYTFNLSVPDNADYDLYLYQGDPDSYGQPIILKKSINETGGTTESVEYEPGVSGMCYILVRWVSGSGMFCLESTDTAMRDVAVTNVEVSSNQVYAGAIVYVNVTVENEGAMVETFDVTAYYDDSAIGTQTVVDLLGGAQREISFAWNTTNIGLYIEYTIRAEASLLPEEIDLTDNVYVDGTVRVKLPGDVDGDEDVDIADLGYIARAFGTTPKWPHGTDWSQWNPQADINNDKKVNAKDLYLASKNYGWTDY